MNKSIWLCDGGYIEYEEHVFLTCSMNKDIRLAHNIVVMNFHSLLQLVPFGLGFYISNIISYRPSALGTS